MGYKLKKVKSQKQKGTQKLKLEEMFPEPEQPMFQISAQKMKCTKL